MRAPAVLLAAGLAAVWSSFEAPPAGSGGLAASDVEFVGSRLESPGLPGAPRRSGFGHLGLYDCQHNISELLSSSRVR